MQVGTAGFPGAADVAKLLSYHDCLTHTDQGSCDHVQVQGLPAGAMVEPDEPTAARVETRSGDRAAERGEDGTPVAEAVDGRHVDVVVVMTVARDVRVSLIGCQAPGLAAGEGELEQWPGTCGLRRLRGNSRDGQSYRDSAEELQVSHGVRASSLTFGGGL
jgi:hypothetical protein